MQKSTAQEVTKFIRNKSEPADRRLALAVDIFYGNIDVVLPKRELVLAEWLLSALGCDAKFQQNREAWALLERCLERLSSESKQRVLFNGKAHLALVNSLATIFETRSVEALPNLAKVTKSWNLGGLNTVQSKELLCKAALCTQELVKVNKMADLSELENWLLLLSVQVQAQVAKLKAADELFSIYSQLEELPDAVNAVLSMLLRLDWFPKTMDLTLSQCESVLKAVVASDIKVGERVRDILFEHPVLISRALRFIPAKILSQSDLEVIGKKLVDSWPESKDSITSLIQRYPNFLSSTTTDSLLNKLRMGGESELISSTLEVILEGLARNRSLYSKLDEENSLLALCLFDQYDDALDVPVRDAFKTLSAKQVGSFISNTNPEFLTLITNALTFDIAHTQLVKTALEARYENMPPMARYNTSALGVTPNGVSDSTAEPTDFGTLLQYFSVLENELAQTGTLSAKISLHKSLTLSSPETIHVLRRFKHLISLLPEKQTKRIIKQLNSYAWLGDDIEIFEYENLATLILESYLKGKTGAQQLILQFPQEAMPTAVLSSFIDFALESANIKILSQVMSWDGASHVLKPVGLTQILALAQSLTLSDLKSPFKVFQLLSQKSLIPQNLQQKLELDNWRHVVLALAHPAESPLFNQGLLALQSPNSAGSIGVAAFVLANRIVPVDEISSEYLALVASRMDTNDVHASQIFQLMVERSFDFLGLTAFFVKCGCSFPQEYSEYVSTFSSDKQELLMLEASGSRQYGLAKCLLSALNSKELAIAHFGRMLALSNQTPAKHTDEELAGLLTAVSGILTESGWLVSQFAVEQILLLLTSVSELPFCIANFKLLSEVLSRVILFHRHRLTGRSHLLIVLLSSMMSAICAKGSQQTSNLSEFGRLIKTLCQGQIKRGRGEKDQSLMSSAARARKNTGRLAGSLLANYIHLSIRGTFDNEAGTLLREPVFDLLKTMSKSNINVFTTFLDDSGRALFKQIYVDYLRQNRHFSGK